MLFVIGIEEILSGKVTLILRWLRSNNSDWYIDQFRSNHRWGFIGLFLGSKISEKLKTDHSYQVWGCSPFFIHSLFLKTQNSLVVLGSILIGVLLGEWAHIQEGVERLGIWLESRFSKSEVSEERNKFIKGFLTTTLIFCIGPMAILGAIQDGLSGNTQTLVIKSVLDGFAAMAFASTLGFGVLFSSVMVLIYQVQFRSWQCKFQGVMTDAMILELTATGGVILAAIAISNLLEIKKIRTASFLPALILAPLIVYLIRSLIKKSLP